MNSAVVDDLVAIVPPLLRTLEMLGMAARHLNPPDLKALVQAIGAPDAPLRAAAVRMQSWPAEATELKLHLEAAIEATVVAADGLRAAAATGGDMRAAFRALRYVPRAQAALYPLAAELEPVSRYFLPPNKRDDAELAARLGQTRSSPLAGVSHGDGEPGSRGGYSLYVPEYYAPDRPWPLVMALHGGSGNGGAFLWSWLRDARAHGAILVAPTAIGSTWALMGDEPDAANLALILDTVRGQLNIDPTRLLLSGMSDGGTFSYVAGLEAGSPFTHLAPVAAAFHPFLVEGADALRIAGLPVHIAHGALDWMFPVELAQQAQQALSAAGARVTYREIDDLSHCYPREINGELLAWLDSTAKRA